MKNIINELSLKLLPEYIDIRRYIHKNPETSFCEYNTSELVTEKLDKIGILYKKNIVKTGVLGEINNNGKTTILLRADMDALDITEKNNTEYSSVVPGKSHACGHDVHTTILLMTSEILSNIKQSIKGNVKFCFQPGEETDGGALPMINEGILENPKVDYCCGLHVDPTVNTGKILVSPGAIMASPDNFELKIVGVGGHGATPDKCIDPIMIASEIIKSLKIVEKNLTSSSNIVVISTCSVNTHENYNVIPDEVKLLGTYRTLNENLRKVISNEIEKCATSICEKYNAKCIFKDIPLYPVLKNDEIMVDKLLKSSINVLGKDNVIFETKKEMIGEDFSYFANKVPSVYFKLGTMLKDRPTSLHASDFDVDEECILWGARVLSNFVIDVLNEKAAK